MQWNLFSYDICHVLQIRVLYFHVLQFHALQFDPSFSCPAFSVNPIKAAKGRTQKTAVYARKCRKLARQRQSTISNKNTFLY